MSCATDGKNRTRPSTAIYRAVMMEFERQRLARGLSMAQVDDLAGTQDGYYAKMLYPDTPLGRQARWETVQDVADALFGRGFAVQMVGSEPSQPSTLGLDKGMSTNSLQIRHWRHSRHFKTLGKSGGSIRMSKLSEKARIRLAKKAGKASMRKLTAAERKERARNASIARWKVAKATKTQSQTASHRLAGVSSEANR